MSAFEALTNDETYPARLREGEEQPLDSTELEQLADAEGPAPDLFDEPEAHNRWCADAAALSVAHFARTTGILDQEAPETAMSDLVGNLFHLADLLEIDFDEIIERGRYHYSYEIRGIV